MKSQKSFRDKKHCKKEYKWHLKKVKKCEIVSVIKEGFMLMVREISYVWNEIFMKYLDRRGY